MILSDLKGKEVFIVAGDEDQDSTEIFVADTWDDLTTYLKMLTPATDYSKRVFHGIVTSAEFLPISMYGKSAFIICQDPLNTEKGCIGEIGSESVEDMAKDITNLLENAGGVLFAKQLSIDDIFILYGYQLQTCIAVDEDDLDEEVIEMCGIIGNEVEKAAYTALQQNIVGD